MRKQLIALALLLIAGLIGGVLLAIPAGSTALAAGIGAQPGQQAATATPGVPGFITSTPAADGSVTHVVKSGEFLITIAQAYGISLDELLPTSRAFGRSHDSILGLVAGMIVMALSLLLMQ